MEKVFAYLEASRDENLKELTEYLAIPSISALPEHKEDVQAAAKWTASYLEKIGMEQVSQHILNDFIFVDLERSGLE